MNSKQRIAAAMDHKKPDRVPVMCQLALGHYFLNCGHSPSEIWFDTKTFAKALVELQQRYEFDGILVNIPGRPSDWKSRLKSYKKIGNTEHLYWRNPARREGPHFAASAKWEAEPKAGLETIFPPDDNPQTYRPGRMPLERANYSTVDINDPATYRLPGYVWNTWHAPELWDIDPQADLSEPAAYPVWFTSALAKYSHLSLILWNCSAMSRPFLL